MAVQDALAVTDQSTRERILAATAEVLGRNGMTKLSLSEVALQAGVSRPTLYRWFASKRELLDAFVVWERQYYERAAPRRQPICPRARGSTRRCRSSSNTSSPIPACG
jgi:TetR/AcrR family transcriptional regulator, repressor for uid operon